jgi:RNA-splicing ligase RtcB
LTLEHTASVECRKYENVLDENPGAYKSIDAMMAAERDLVEVAHTVKQPRSMREATPHVICCLRT